MSSNDLANKVAVITGASSGFGQETAILFAQRGASVVLCGRDLDRLQAAVDACTKASGGHADRFITSVGDLNDSGVRHSIINKTVQTFGRLDILVANAGVTHPEDDIFTATEASFDQTFEINVKSVFFLIQAAIPHLEKSGGNVVSVSSVASTLAPAHFGLYAMSKAAIDHMTRCVALDLAPKGIRVNAVNPSYVHTRLRRTYGPNYEEHSKMFAALEGPRSVLRGCCITSEDVANVIGFLASDAARSITGQCHVVDGGRNFMGCGQL